MGLGKTKVTPTGMKILLWFIATLIIVNLLARFGVINLTPWQTDIITVAAIFFVAAEIGVMSAIKGRKKLDGFGIFGAIVVIAALLGLVLRWVGIEIQVFTTIAGFVDAALLVYVIKEIFS